MYQVDGSVHSIEVNSSLKVLLQKHQSVFQKELGTIRNHKAVLCLKEGVKPRFWRPRPVPLAVKDDIGCELDHLDKEGVLKEVAHSDKTKVLIVIMETDWY